jgi:hypothetical protein
MSVLLVAAGGAGKVESANQQSERGADENDPAEGGEAVERALKRRLHLDQLADPCLRVAGSVGG